MACKYCYANSGPSNYLKMDNETLYNTIEKPLKYFGKKQTFGFIWHGGEPLLMGIDFFKKVVDIQKPFVENGFRIKNSIQTNLTNINEDYVNFFKENKFSIGFSLDGPKYLNDQTRVMPNGSGSFDIIMDKISLLRKNGVKVGALCVVTKTNVLHPKEVYEFFKENKIGVKFNPMFISGRATKKYAITPQEYGEFLIKIFDLWLSDKNKIWISNFYDYIKSILTNRPVGCIFTKYCSNNFFSVTPTGDVLPCGRWDDSPEFKYGNINTDSMVEILASPKRKKLLLRNYHISKKCRSCEFVNICNGGCPYIAYKFYGNIYERDYYCEAYKMIFSHIKNKMCEILGRSCEKKYYEIFSRNDLELVKKYLNIKVQ